MSIETQGNEWAINLSPLHQIFLKSSNSYFLNLQTLSTSRVCCTKKSCLKKVMGWVRYSIIPFVLVHIHYFTKQRKFIFELRVRHFVFLYLKQLWPNLLTFWLTLLNLESKRLCSFVQVVLLKFRNVISFAFYLNAFCLKIATTVLKWPVLQLPGCGSQSLSWFFHF